MFKKLGFKILKVEADEFIFNSVIQELNLEMLLKLVLDCAYSVFRLHLTIRWDVKYFTENDDLALSFFTEDDYLINIDAYDEGCISEFILNSLKQVSVELKEYLKGKYARLGSLYISDDVLLEIKAGLLKESRKQNGI